MGLPTSTNALNLSVLGTYSTGRFDQTAAEIPAYDPATRRTFVVNGATKAVDVLDTSNPAAPTRLFSFAVTNEAAGITVGDITSVAVKNGVAAVAVVNADPNAAGRVVFFSTSGNPPTLLATAETGVWPDQLTFTPDGRRLVVANESEQNSAGHSEGSVSIIDLTFTGSTLTGAQSRHATFTEFNARAAELRAAGVRIAQSRTVAEDLEPEYSAVSPDGKTAFVTLQENNAVAVVNLDTAKVTAILPLGLKNHSVAGNGLDASDRDNAINIANWPVYGAYQPDAIATYTNEHGQLFFVTANEGDTRDPEMARVSSLTLDATAFPNAADLQKAGALGRLNVFRTDGDTDGDGDIDRLVAPGARSFTIRDSQGNIVFDSGDQFEQIVAAAYPNNFNSNHTGNNLDSRSDDKGPEPEGLTVGTVNGRTYAFIGLERQGGIMVYDITDPKVVSFVGYTNNRAFTPSGDLSQSTYTQSRDLGPEGLVFVAAKDSPTGKPMLIVSNEVSGTTTFYDITVPTSSTYRLQILHGSDFEAGMKAIDRAPLFGAIVDYLEDTHGNTLILSSGDNFLPGPFLNASTDSSLKPVLNSVYNTLYGLPRDATGDNNADSFADLREGAARADITLLNIFGVDVSALGNHDFDLGTEVLAGALGSDIRSAGSNTNALASDRWLGAQFPSVSANLTFSGDSNLAGLYTSSILDSKAFATNFADRSAPKPKKIAPATIVDVNGEKIGVVGATTQILQSISSTGGVTVNGVRTNDMPALAAILQPVVDAVIATGVNKVVLVSHLQQIELEEALIKLLKGVDVVVAGGSHTVLADSEDVTRGMQAGDKPARSYPIVTTNADGDTAVIVNTGGEYSYVGRLVLDFDAQGKVIANSIDPAVSGAYAATREVVTRLYKDQPGETDQQALDQALAAGTKGGMAKQITDAVAAVIQKQDGAIFGKSSVFLDGRRTTVRTEESNLGNLSADANLWYARQVDSSVTVSIKNGGGIRDIIGAIDTPSYGSVARLLTTQANPLANKAEGDISQLDVTNSLRFNNSLSLVTLTPQQLVQTLEHAVAATKDGATPGQFAQVGGLSFSFDPTAAAGARVRSVALLKDDGSLTPIYAAGKVVDGAPTAIRTVTLGFLTTGGDSYPLKDFIAADTAFANVVDLSRQIVDPGKAGFAATGTEQDAFAEYMAARYATTPFDERETSTRRDDRIQNLSARTDTVLLSAVTGTAAAEMLLGSAAANTIQAGAGNDTVLAGAGNDTMAGGEGDDLLLGENGRDTAVFAGNRADYDITELTAEEIKALEAGRLADTGFTFDPALPVLRVAGKGDQAAQGSDIVQAEILKFANGTIEISAKARQEKIGQGARTEVDLSKERPKPEVLVRELGLNGIGRIDGTAAKADSRHAEAMDTLLRGGLEKLAAKAGKVVQHTVSTLDGLTVGSDELAVVRIDGAADTTFRLPAGVKVAILEGKSRALVGNGGSEQMLVGNNEDNVINTGGGSATVVGGAGNSLYGTPTTGGGTVLFQAGPGNDTVIGASGNTTVFAGAGRNLVGLGTGTHLVYSAGNDTIFAGSSTATIGLSAGNSVVVGGEGRTTVFAASDNNTVFGGSGGGLLSGGTGSNNVIVAGAGASTLIGGAGADTLAGGAANDLLWAIGGRQTIMGGAGNDMILAGSANGAQVLADGGAGDDVLVAGKGSSTLFGGTGSNIFVFSSVYGGGKHVIDFGTGTNYLAFQGYQGLSAAKVMADARVSGGVASISLTDGTTVTVNGAGSLDAGRILIG